MKRLLACLIAVASASQARVSLAEPSQQSVEVSTNDARLRFRRGVAFYLDGSYDAAFAELTKAYEIAPDYRVLYNLAQVQTQRHDYVAALELFDAYLKDGGSKITAERRAQVESARLQLKTFVATLWVSGTTGAEVRIDGASIGVLPLREPVLLNPGVYQLQLRKPGYDPLTHELTIAGAEAVRLELPMRALPVDATSLVVREPVAPAVRGPAAIPPHRREEGGSSAPFWVSLIATAALAGGAATFGVLAKQADDDIGRALAQVPANRAALHELRARVERDSALCDGLAAGALVGAGLTIFFALSGTSADERLPDHRTFVATASGFEWAERF